jgi:hypothetical protein
MTPTGGGYDADIGARTASGRPGFVGRHPDADDVNAPGGGELAPDADAVPDVEAPDPAEPRASDPPSGVPDDLKRGERNSPLTDS